MTSTIKKALLAATIALSAIGGATAYSTTYLVDTMYFEDSSYRTMVGEHIKQCGGGTYTWGKTTGYKRVTHEPCSGGGF